jgi:biopolymer transport protein ExbB/TolQ
MAVRERAELAGDELDSSLGLVRYIAWAIPAVGFIGTVRGIGDALSFAEQAIQGDISAVTTWLGLAFNSTFVGLALCIVLMFVLHVVQGDKRPSSLSANFCRDRLIDDVKVPTKDASA